MCSQRWPQAYLVVPAHLKHDILAHRRLSPFQNQVAWQMEVQTRYRGLAISEANEIFVTNHKNNCVDVYSIDGLLLRTWGSAGKQPGQFMSPAGIAVTKRGEVIVADKINCRVQVFSCDGVFLRQWGSLGSNNGQFVWTSGVAVTERDEVIVTDAHKRRVQVFRLEDGAFLRKWVTKMEMPHTAGLCLIRATPQHTEHLLILGCDVIHRFCLDGTLVSTWYNNFSSVCSQLFKLLRNATVDLRVLSASPGSVAVSRRGRVIVVCGFKVVALD